MNAIELITAKRDGERLSTSQLKYLIANYSIGKIPDYQMAAFAMAVYFQGMEIDEISALTEAMLNSGLVMSWPENGRAKVDKHSTGGIGDKISIPLAPILACLELDVPMISGRGLGATGGTLDKLESIPGFRTDLSVEETQNIVEKVGCVITGASEQITPADRKLYALRDVTATVPSIPLITASILSKKLAEGLDALVLDVKCGSGAFMKTADEANTLGQTLVDVANKSGVKTSALITNMNQPLGKLIGNSVEIEESVAILKNEGPADVRELVVELACELLNANGSNDLIANRKQIDEIVASGSAFERFEQMVKEQGGQLHKLTRRGSTSVIASEESGIVQDFDSEKIGWAIIELGGGRKTIGDNIDHAAGVECLIDIGDSIEKGQPIFNVFSNRDFSPQVKLLLNDSVKTGEIKAARADLIMQHIRHPTQPIEKPNNG